ncbi:MULTISPECIES: hypothetical protein [Mycobacteroides]|uniref:hypothetical protein n=1 Tax=Mycobacteroides TaxID=670516 RepID=UPI000929A6DF|nr:MULTISPECIES: hypothetical protein [Mycobacteroides]SIL61466.1 Uncharacterised protein [Mycobacteroides abscessus subsp. abscessus]
MSALQRYRKKPLIIEAMQWTSEEQSDDIFEWIEANGGTAFRDEALSGAPGPEGEDWGSFEIHTLEGDMEISPFDYVILGVGGEFYPCKPDIFEKTYELVES